MGAWEGGGRGSPSKPRSSPHSTRHWSWTSLPVTACFMPVTCLLHACYVPVTCLLHACFMPVSCLLQVLDELTASEDTLNGEVEVALAHLTKRLNHFAAESDEQIQARAVTYRYLPLPTVTYRRADPGACRQPVTSVASFSGVHRSTAHAVTHATHVTHVVTHVTHVVTRCRRSSTGSSSLLPSYGGMRHVVSSGASRWPLGGSGSRYRRRA